MNFWVDAATCGVFLHIVSWIGRVILPRGDLVEWVKNRDGFPYHLALMIFTLVLIRETFGHIIMWAALFIDISLLTTRIGCELLYEKWKEQHGGRHS